MIFTDRTIIVQKGTSSINDTIILYRGDKEVEIRFTLSESLPFRFGSGASPNIIEKTEAAYGQLVIKTPNDLPTIFSEVAPTNEGKIVFTITGEMIDEITEVGNYTFQIRLFDESMNSRASIPEVVDGIEIREPIASEDETNVVEVAIADYAIARSSEPVDAFDTEGNYIKTNWQTRDRITAEKLNKMELGISENSSQIKDTEKNIQSQINNIVLGTDETGEHIKAEVQQARSSFDTLNDRITANEKKLDSIYDEEIISQISKLNWTNEKGYYVGLSKYGYPDGSINGKANCRVSDLFEVNKGEQYIITSEVPNGIANFVIFNNSNNVVKIVPDHNVGADNVSTLTDYVISIPAGGTKMGISKMKDDTSFDFSKIEYINKADKNKTKLYTMCFPTWESGKGYYVALSNYGHPDGSLGSTSTHKACAINVSPGEKYILSTSILNRMAPFVIFDSGDNVLEIYSNIIGDGITKLTNYEITIPSNGSKLGISCYLNNASEFKLLKESKETGNAIESLDYLTKIKDNELGILSTYPSVNEEGNQINTLEFINPYKYPLVPVFGWEYLSHWYEKLYNLADVKIVLEGDSITEGYKPLNSSIQDSFLNMRGHHLKKIFKIGNYPMDKLTIVNNGHGGRNTSEYVGNSTYGNPGIITSNPNGFIDAGMNNNPDLVIIAYGMNDADITNTYLPSNLNERLKLYENNMREALQRIRGNKSVNGRPSYNRSLSDLSIIICNPTVSFRPNTGRSNDLWNQYIRVINQKLCREFYCAFCDFTFRTYDHKSDGSNNWSVVNADGTKGWIHPNKYSDAQITSMLQDLVYPMALWNIEL